jgi:phosphoglycolate phosphatase
MLAFKPRQTKAATRRFTAVLFDLDGTVVDPGEGIANTIQFVLDTLDIDHRFDGSAKWYVGPSLSEIFARILSPALQPELIERAVSLYIERFASHGAAESVVYSELAEILTELSSSARLFLVTSKNTAVAEQMLRSHLLLEHFDSVIGTEADRRFATKADAVRLIIKEFELDSEAAAMVGDRMHDIIAGKDNNIFTVGVTYGYGTRGELIEAGADAICDTPSELLQFFRSNY